MTTWQKAAIGFATVIGIVYCAAVVFGTVLVSKLTDDNVRLMIELLYALSVIGITRKIVVWYKVFCITNIANLIFIYRSHADLLKRGPDINGNVYAPRIQLRAIDVSKEWREKLRDDWFWCVPTRFSFLGCRFDWSWNPSKMIEAIKNESSDSGNHCNLDCLEFQLSPAAKTTDAYGLGFGIFRIIMEAKLNNGTPLTDWHFGFHPKFGTSVRHKDAPLEEFRDV